jgi:hypothetical protein
LHKAKNHHILFETVIDLIILYFIFLCSALDSEFILNLVTRESCGEDIVESDNEYFYESEEDSYESNFNDDGGFELSDKKYVSEYR